MRGRNLRVCQRLVWKNVRETWLLWLTLAIGICLAQWGYSITGMQRDDPEAVTESLLVIIWVPSVCCAAAHMILGFSGERDGNTDVRLSAMNLSAGVALLSVFVTAILAVAVLALIGTANAYLIAPLGLKQAILFLQMTGALTPGLLLILAASLLTRSPMRAIVLAAVLIIVGSFVLLGNLAVWSWLGMRFALAASFTVVGLLVVNYLLARRWCRTPYHGPLIPLPAGLLSRPASEASMSERKYAATRVPRSLGLLLRFIKGIVGSPGSRATRTVQIVMLREAYRSRWFLLLVGLCLWGMTPSPGGATLALTPCLVILSVACGMMSVIGDHGGRIRFFSERGISWRTLWIGRTLFWSLVCVTIAGVFVGFLTAIERFAEPPLLQHIADPTSRWVSIVAVGYAGFFGGQLSGLHSRSAIQTFGQAFLVLVALYVWLRLLSEEVRVSFVVGVTPLAIGFLVACVLRFPAWTNLRDGRGQVGRTAVVVATSMGLAWLLPVLHFVSLVPEPEGPPFTLVDNAPGDADLLLPGRGFKAHQRVGPSLHIKPPEARESAEPWYNRASSAERYSDLDDVLVGWLEDNQSEIDLLGSAEPDSIQDVAYSTWLMKLHALRLADERSVAQAIRFSVRSRLAVGTPDARGGYWLLAQLCCHPSTTTEDIQLARDGIRELRQAARWRSAGVWYVDLPSRGSLVQRMFGYDIVADRQQRFLRATYTQMDARCREAMRAGEPLWDEYGNIKADLDERVQDIPELEGLGLDAMPNWCEYDIFNEIDALQRAHIGMALLDVIEFARKERRIPTSLTRVDPTTGKPFEWIAAGSPTAFRVYPREIAAGVPFLRVKPGRYYTLPSYFIDEIRRSPSGAKADTPKPAASHKAPKDNDDQPN